MKIGIIGAGFTGLSAGYYLTKLGHDVTIFEKTLNQVDLLLDIEKKDGNRHLRNIIITGLSMIIQP